MKIVLNNRGQATALRRARVINCEGQSAALVGIQKVRKLLVAEFALSGPRRAGAMHRLTADDRVLISR